MSKVAIKGNPLGTGTFTIEAPNSDTDSTVVLPVGSGSVVLTDATQTLTNKSISASQVNSGTLDSARIPDLAASKITSGTIATARLASGTADSTTFLRGDQTWQTISTTPPTDFDAVGTYVSAYYGITSTATIGGRRSFLTRGTTVAGSSLRVNSRSTSSNIVPVSNEVIGGFEKAGIDSTTFPTTNTTTLTGTWRLMTGGAWTENNTAGTVFWYPMLWVRIS